MSETAVNRVENVLFTVSSGQCAKCDGKGIAVIPEIFPCDVGVFANIGSSAIRQPRLRESEKTGMPQA